MSNKDSRSLDSRLVEHAKRFAAALSAKAETARKEADIHFESETQLAFIAKDLDIELEGKPEFTLAKGSVDSVYQRVIIEYKNPASVSERIGPTLDSAGSKNLVKQIKQRFEDMEAEHGYSPESLFGVGLDGRRIIFVRHTGAEWRIDPPANLTEFTAKRFLWALFNLGQKGKPYSPSFLADDFAGKAKIPQRAISVFYDAITKISRPKAQVLFAQWRILFGEVCGWDVAVPSDKILKLAKHYGLATKTPDAAALLYAVHSYYAILMKLLAAEVIAFFHKLPTPNQKIFNATTSKKMFREMQDFESGSIFKALNITNFLEGDLFTWYLDEWSDEIEGVIRETVQTLDEYNPGTLSVDPHESRDLLKQLYHRLFPKDVRHDLGEYYTPDWLADHVLNEVGYVADADQRLLDPACGSGTFLVMAISRIRENYYENREKFSYEEGELTRKILNNVIGFDLNPIAVMAARTNYLIAIRDLLSHVDHVEIPVYLADSILTPAEHGDLFSGPLGSTRKFDTAAGEFLIPSGICTSRELLGRYAGQLEFCIEHRYSADEFMDRLKDEDIPVDDEPAHVTLFEQLAELRDSDRNGIWARIIKNAFAPVFIEKVDVVVGNPPWINWRHLPTKYRADISSLWTKYNLFTHSGIKARLGAAMDDISVLMTYVASDRYLKDGGRIGFVITQSLFQSSGGGQGFRSFSLPDEHYLKIDRVSDFTSFQPFEDAANRTATFSAKKSTKKTRYPVAYWEYRPSVSRSAIAELPKMDSSAFAIRKLAASPVSAEQTSAWLVSPASMQKVLQKISGTSPYRARVGAHSGGAAGVYWVDVERETKKRFVVSNRWDAGRNTYPSATAPVEKDMVRPLLRGRDVNRWTASSSAHIVIPYYPANHGKAISESELKRSYPLTYAYFDKFRKKMEARAHYKRHFEPHGAPFWSMYNVGDYTFSQFKVAWREQSSEFKSVALISSDDSGLVVPDAKLTIVPCASSEEAFYLSGVLNSSPVRATVKAFVISVQVSTYITEHLNIPQYSPSSKLHRDIAAASERCHQLAEAEDSAELEKEEAKLDKLTGRLWSLTKKDLSAINMFLAS